MFKYEVVTFDSFGKLKSQSTVAYTHIEAMKNLKVEKADVFEMRKVG